MDSDLNLETCNSERKSPNGGVNFCKGCVIIKNMNDIINITELFSSLSHWFNVLIISSKICGRKVRS